MSSEENTVAELLKRLAELDSVRKEVLGGDFYKARAIAGVPEINYTEIPAANHTDKISVLGVKHNLTDAEMQAHKYWAQAQAPGCEVMEIFNQDGQRTVGVRNYPAQRLNLAAQKPTVEFFDSFVVPPETREIVNNSGLKTGTRFSKRDASGNPLDMQPEDIQSYKDLVGKYLPDNVQCHLLESKETGKKQLVIIGATTEEVAAAVNLRDQTEKCQAAIIGMGGQTKGKAAAGASPGEPAQQPSASPPSFNSQDVAARAAEIAKIMKVEPAGTRHAGTTEDISYEEVSSKPHSPEMQKALAKALQQNTQKATTTENGRAANTFTHTAGEGKRARA